MASLGDICAGAQSRFTNPGSLKIIGLVDAVEWTSLEIGIKVAAFEGKKGAVLHAAYPEPFDHPTVPAAGSPEGALIKTALALMPS